ncbi:MAG: polysaccharide biosynthesis protein [bacterium]|jgi:stage V sporulation protein B|nr:polysaccharide biosynthesis protein [Bacillota bacterium]
MSRGQSFLGGAALLAAAGILSKVLGAAFRIPLARLIGPEGMGLYGMAYPLYAMILALSTAGIPVAISKLVAEKLAENKPEQAGAVFRVASRSLVISGLLFTVLTVVMARVFVVAGLLRDPRAFWPLIATAPAVLLVALNSALRGYFQGFQDMRPTAVSQVVEQLLRAVTALGLGYLLLPYGLEFAAAGAAFGAVTGAAAAGVMLWWYKRTSFSSVLAAIPWPHDWPQVLKRILALAIPVTLSSLVMPIMQNLDVLLVPVRLEAAGYTVAEATSLFGELTQMAFTLVNLPVIVTGALAVSLVPAVSAVQATPNRSQLKKYIGAALRLTVLLELPAVAGLYLLAEPVMDLLYDLPAAGPTLAALSASCLFLGLNQTSAGILQGLGRTDLPVWSLAAGAVVKVVLTYILTGIPALGIKGAAWATVATFATAAFLNARFIDRLVGLPWDAKEFVLKPLVATGGMGAIVILSYRLVTPGLGSHLATLVAIGIGIVSYGLLLFVVRAVQANDLALLSAFGHKLSRRLDPRRR